MNPNDPQFLYIILVLPALFGITLIGDGINKLVRNNASGIITLVFGFLFFGLVVFGYIFFSTYLVGV